MKLFCTLALGVVFAVGVGNSQQQGAPAALLLDGEGPWREAAWRSNASAFASLLREAGYQVQIVEPADLAGALKQQPRVLLAAPSLERLPLSAFQAIATHTAGGGSLLAGGGEPFREAMHRSPDGQWITVQQLMLGLPRRAILNPADAKLTRSIQPPQDAFAQRRVSGPNGHPDSLEVRISRPVRLDPLQTEAFSQSPFENGQSTTIVTVRGTPQENLLIEWREDDGLRWWARVPLGTEWKSYALRPSDFSQPPSGGRQQAARAQFDPRRARVLAFGLAYEVNTPPAAPVEFSVGPIAVGAAPRVEDFAVPVLETISPWYKQYDSVRNGHAVRIPIARPRGLTMAQEPDGRYEAIGELLNPAATRYTGTNGAALFWIPDAVLSGRDRAELIAALRRAGGRIALLNAGSREFVHLTDEAIGLGARIMNASGRAVSAEVAWVIRRSGESVFTRRVSAELRPGETRDVAAEPAPALAAGEYRIETAIASGENVYDRMEASLRVIDPQAARPVQPRLRVEAGHFMADGRQVFLNGVNFWPRNVSGLEPARYWDHWLTPRNYDPDVIEADLAALEQLGFNLVSIQYNRVEQARPLMDFLERCRRHHIWAHLSIGSANNPQRLAPRRDTELIGAAHLAGNEAVFGYELAWEPHLGRHSDRRNYDGAWRDWVDEQYGSLAAAEREWGMTAPRDDHGELTNPLDDQIGADGPHRTMVAAYRRFVDDLVSRAYGRAVRHIRSLDPEALIAVRTGWGGTGQRGNNLGMGYDLASGAAHLDAASPEGYGMPATFPEARRTGFVTAYARHAGAGKPVFWLEFGASIGPRDGTPRTRANQALLCETTMKMVADSGADATAVWWFPGGWRYNERSDFGILNPDGSPRDSAKVLSKWGRKFNAALPHPGTGEPVVIRIDRDADSRGLNGMWERYGAEFVAAREAGRPVQLVSAGTGTDTGDMPIVQTGNLPYRGVGPLKYVNAEIAGVRISWDGGEKWVENGEIAELPSNGQYRIAVSLVNTGEAGWLPRDGAPRPGSCVLRTSAGDAPIRAKVRQFGRTTVAELAVNLANDPIEISGRMAAEQRGSFGEPLRVLLRPARAPVAGVVDATTLERKVLLGYQGWFNCPGDGSPESNWRSWSRGVPAPETLTVDMYPDLSEMDRDDLCAVPGMTVRGNPAYLYSASKRGTVSRHFRWMREYGLDGVLVQRFVTSIGRKRAGGDVVLKNVMAAAAESGRVFAIEYDITGSNPATFLDTMREDWKYLVDELKITEHPNYLHHHGKPVLSIWGMGLEEDRHVPHDPVSARKVVEWFQSGAPRRYQTTYMGGTPSRWRTLSNDSRKDPGWSDVFRMMDVVQPWTVGRYRNPESADRWRDEMVAPDLALAQQNGQIYMPVIFPGFSWNNLKRDAPRNAIPRNRGEFLWRQAYNARTAGATTLKIAMFDEVNEGTAIFKLAPHRHDAPDQGYWLTLDADGYDLPSDWYLRLAGEITRMFHGEIPATPNLPEKPGPPWR